MTASAAATGPAAAGSGRLITKGFTCGHETKILSSEVSRSSNWEMDTGQVVGHTSALPLKRGTPCLFEPRACQGEEVIRSSAAEKEHAASVVLTAPPRLRVWASACSSRNSHNMTKSDFHTKSPITGLNELLHYWSLQLELRQASSVEIRWITLAFRCFYSILLCENRPSSHI